MQHLQYLQYCGTETYIRILTLEQYLGDGHQYNRSLIILICIGPLWPRVLEYIRCIYSTTNPQQYRPYRDCTVRTILPQILLCYIYAISHTKQNIQKHHMRLGRGGPDDWAIPTYKWPLGSVAYLLSVEATIFISLFSL